MPDAPAGGAVPRCLAPPILHKRHIGVYAGILALWTIFFTSPPTATRKGHRGRCRSFGGPQSRRFFLLRCILPRGDTRPIYAQETHADDDENAQTSALVGPAAIDLRTNERLFVLISSFIHHLGSGPPSTISARPPPALFRPLRSPLVKVIPQMTERALCGRLRRKNVAKIS